LSYGQGAPPSLFNQAGFTQRQADLDLRASWSG